MAMKHYLVTPDRGLIPEEEASASVFGRLETLLRDSSTLPVLDDALSMAQAKDEILHDIERFVETETERKSLDEQIEKILFGVSLDIAILVLFNRLTLLIKVAHGEVPNGFDLNDIQELATLTPEQIQQLPTNVRRVIVTQFRSNENLRRRLPEIAKFFDLE